MTPPAAFSECGLLLLFGGAKQPLLVAFTDRYCQFIEGLVNPQLDVT